MAVKAPERLLSRQELEFLTGLSKPTVLKLLDNDWKVPGGTKLIKGEYRLPVSFYNAWVDGQDAALATKEGACG